MHPTGLVKPDDADAKIKFLAAEATWGKGAICCAGIAVMVDIYNYVYIYNIIHGGVDMCEQ